MENSCREHSLAEVEIIERGLSPTYDYLDACRRKRNIVEYDCVSGATAEDVKELREFVQQFQKEVLFWLSQQKIK